MLIGWSWSDSTSRLVNGQGRKPLSIVVTAGQCGNGPHFAAVLDATRVPRIGRVDPGAARGRCWRTRRTAVPATASTSAHGGIRATIPVKSDQTANRKRNDSAGGRPPVFDREH